MPTLIIAPEQLPPWALRTEIPTLVADRCEDACDLAVWRAIRWLISLAGRDRLGIDARTIAAHAKVDVKTALRCIHGDQPTSRAKRRPRNPKRGLVGLGLLEIVGHQAVGKLNPRPIYRIPRTIEEQNAHYTRELLGRLGVTPPPPAPPPGQASLPLDLGPIRDGSQARPDPYVDQADGSVPFSDQGARLAALAPDPYVDQADGPVPFSDQAGPITARAQQDGQAWPEAGAVPDPHVDQAAVHAAPAPDPHVDHWRDGRTEGRREGAIPPPQSLLGSQPIPPAPSAALVLAHPRWVVSELPAHPADLWRRACSSRRLIDDDQLAVLASEHDGPTGGHGWHWLGRAILAAALNEDIHTVAKVRRTMERWRAEDSYGSDVPAARRAPSTPALSPAPDRGVGAGHLARPARSARLGQHAIFEEV